MADKLLTFGPQPEQQDEGVSNNLLPVGTTLATGTGLAALGFYKTNSGKRIWDTYNSAIAATESLSPGGILKTFRISELTSILGTQEEENLTRFLNAGKYGEMLKKSISESAVGSVKFMPSAGGIFGEILDETGKAVAQGVRIQAGTQQGNAIADYYARILGIELGPNESINDYILRQTWEESDLKVPFNIWKDSLPQSEKYRKVVLAAPMAADASARLVKAQVVSNLARAHTASQIGRLNNLLRKPLDIVDDIPILGNIVDKFPGLGTMATKPGSSTAMLGGFVKKAIVAGAAWKALEYADYLRSQDSITAAPLTTGIFAAAGGIGLAKPGAPFNKIGLLAGAALGLGVSFMPRFNEGIFYGGASLLSDTDTLRAQVSDITGYTQSIKEQNEITKNLITVGTAVGFAGTGALVAGLGSYGVYLRDVYKERNAGETLAHLAERKRFETGALVKEFWESERGRKLAEKPLLNKISKIRSPLAIGAIAGLAVWQGAATALSLLSGNIRTAIPGLPLIMSEESAAEKEAIYSGEQEVAIKKGRWWEAGRNLYEGDRTEYYRQHAIPRLRARAYQKGLYGSEEERWAYDPMVNPIKALFGSDEWKYYYERKYAYERPAPISKPLFADVPFVGPLLAATLGELIKPTKLIRPEEWQVEGGGFLYRPDIRGETEPAYQYGGLLPGSPVMPGETSQLLNELNYRRTEMIGLPGFMEESIRKALTGRAEPFQNLQTIAAMGSETNITSWFWEHLNLGGGLALTEGIRRFIPSKRSYMQEYNPLRAESPSWIPEDYFLDLKYGNPFDKIKEAEIRLPGAGFGALNPEVEGLSPEEYPLAYRVKVLGDIAMYSEEYEMALREAKSLLHTLPPNQARIILQTEKQVKAKKKRKEFSEYMSISNELTEEQVTVTDVLSPHLIRTKEYGTANIEVQGIGAVKNAQESMEYMRKALMGRSITIHTPTDDVKKFDSVTSGPRVKALVMMNGSVNIAEQMAQTGLVENNELEREFKQFNYSPNERLAGVLSDAILHNIETPLDYLTPFAPVQKFIHQRSALEDYAATQVYGTKNAFWDKPIENFFAPAKDMFLYKSGLSDSIPDRIQEKRNINEYFDMVKWVKYSRLEQKARMLGDLRAATQARTEKHKTVFGMDVFGNPTNIMRALPRDERDYFSAFINAGDQERQQILEMVPENVKRVYTAQWLSKSTAASFAKKEAGLANEQDLKNINMLRQLRASQGFSYSEGSIDQWMRETSGQVPFDDYIREQKAAEYFATHSLPDPSWIGFNPAVDLDDIRMKYVENHSMDFHDFDLWDQRKASMARKPYIPEAVGQMNANAPYQDAYSASQDLRRLANTYGSGRHKINTYQIDANLGGNRYNITVDDQRKSLVESAFKTLGA